MTAPRVVHITNTDRALRQLLFDQFRMLRDAGYEVSTISPPGAEVSFMEQNGFPHTAVRMNRNFTPWEDLVTLWTLYRIIRRGKFAIVHTHNPKPGLLGQLAARMARTPVVVNTVHGFHLHDNMRPAQRRFYVLIERIAALCSSVILSQNVEDIDTARRERIGSPSQWVFLGNGIDLQRFHPLPNKVEVNHTKRVELGIPPGALVVGCVARLVKAKGVLNLFAAARLVREQIPNVRFLFVGLVEADRKDAVDLSDAERYGITDICHFVGLRYDMPELYSVMDLSVLPSTREGIPRALMEASAMKVPCIATDVRGNRQAVDHGRNGLLVPLHDDAALAVAIVELLSDPKRAGRMGEAGRRVAEERFDERQVFAIIKDVYSQRLRAKGLVAPE